MTLDADRRLPRADRHQDQGRHHRPADDRRRRAEELHPGHRRLRRDPRPRRRRGAQIRRADHRRRRARRRLLLLDAPGGGELGQGQHRRSSRWCSPRPDRSCRCSQATLITAAIGRPAPSAPGRRCSRAEDEQGKQYPGRVGHRVDAPAARHGARRHRLPERRHRYQRARCDRTRSAGNGPP